jgi:hypothetical protein
MLGSTMALLGTTYGRDITMRVMDSIYKAEESM